MSQAPEAIDALLASAERAAGCSSCSAADGVDRHVSAERLVAGGKRQAAGRRPPDLDDLQHLPSAEKRPSKDGCGSGKPRVRRSRRLSGCRFRAPADQQVTRSVVDLNHGSPLTRRPLRLMRYVYVPLPAQL
jgi:hypothetical protein